VTLKKKAYGPGMWEEGRKTKAAAPIAPPPLGAANYADRVAKLLGECAYDYEGGIRDLLADLMHYCKTEQVDFYDELASAEQHFLAET